MNITDELETKPLPVSVTTVPELVRVTVFGEIEVTWGVGLLIAKFAAPDAPPPGEGFETTI